MKKGIKITLALTLFISILLEANYSQSGYPIGAYFNGRLGSSNPSVYKDLSSAREAGINTAFQYCIADSNKDILAPFTRVIPNNVLKSTDYIYHYSAGMYSKWEAENNQTDTAKIGIKHSFGSSTNYDGVDCWYSGTNPGYVNKDLVYGPNYLQYKKYPLYYNANPVYFRIKVRMIKGALTEGSDNVCRLRVVDERDSVLVSMYIKENELPTTWNSQAVFETSYSHNLYGDKGNYTTPYEKILDSDVSKADKIGGVQFKIEWLTDIPVYIDYIEVYDQTIWKEYLDDPTTARTQILNYASNFSNWNNIAFWNSLDEPHSVDSHIPYQTVDSILSNNGYPHLITAFYPESEGQRDGVNSIELFSSGIENTAVGANPNKLMPYYYPYWPQVNNYNENVANVVKTLHRSWVEDKNFWYMTQAMEFREGLHDSTIIRRRPTRFEFRAPVFTALQFAARGIVFWPYFSYWDKESDSSTLYYKRAYAIEDNPNNDSNYVKTDLWYELKSISERLQGALGETILSVNYTGINLLPMKP